MPATMPATDPGRPRLLQRFAPERAGPIEHAPPEGNRWMLLALLSLTALALGASAASLANGFAYDDLPIILQNPLVHKLSDIGIHFVEGYWPYNYGGALYRPITLLAFTVEWVVGRGAPIVFHATNIALYLALTFVVFALARRLLPPVAAWASAALFAVHPVHVEAVANAVGQAEIIAVLSVALGIWVYLRARERGIIRARDSVALLLLLCVGTLAKEQGILLGPLLAVAELTVVADARPLAARVRELWTTVFLVVLGTGLLLGLRYAALGAVGGEYPSIALHGIDFGDRVLTMLGIVPVWTRLLLWPAHLQAEYGPPALGAARSFGLRQLLGLALIAGTVTIAVVTSKRRPVVAFGLGWAALGISLVSNVFIVTGMLVAERTLLLPSIGVVLALGGIMAELGERITWPRTARALATAALGAVLVAGVLRSAARQPVWHDNGIFFQQMVHDAPNAYRGWYIYGDYLRQHGSLAEARAAITRAIGLFQGDPNVYDGMGRLTYKEKGCAAAIPYFEKALAIDTLHFKARGGLYTCLVQTGDTARARKVAAKGAALKEGFFKLIVAQERAATTPAGAVRRK